MTEVIISNNSRTNTPWFKFTPGLRSKSKEKDNLIKTPPPNPKRKFYSILQKIKKKIKQDFQEGEVLIPVKSIKFVKSKTFSSLGASTGICSTKLRIN